MLDKTGRKVKTGDLIQFDEFPPYPLRVRYQRKRVGGARGWLAEKLPPANPTPQCVGGLGHRFTIISR